VVSPPVGPEGAPPFCVLAWAARAAAARREGDDTSHLTAGRGACSFTRTSRRARESFHPGTGTACVEIFYHDGFVKNQ